MKYAFLLLPVYVLFYKKKSGALFWALCAFTFILGAAGMIFEFHLPEMIFGVMK